MQVVHQNKKMNTVKIQSSRVQYQSQLKNIGISNRTLVPIRTGYNVRSLNNKNLPPPKKKKRYGTVSTVRGGVSGDEKGQGWGQSYRAVGDSRPDMSRAR
jgi:hypothetical protein